MQEVYKTMVFEIILQKGIEKTSPFLRALFYVSTSICKTESLLIFLQIFVKTVCAIRKYSKIPPELFQIKFLYLILIKILTIIQNYFFS